MGTRVLPDKNTLWKWYNDEGLSHTEMAKRFNALPERQGEEPVTRHAFWQRCNRDGFPPRNLSHQEVLPANMHPDHVKLYDTEMIRMWHARELGKKFPPKIDQKINSWLQNLNDAKAILEYRRKTIDGWKPVRRRPSDIKGCPVRIA